MNRLAAFAQTYDEADFQDYQQQDYTRTAPAQSPFSVKDLSGLGQTTNGILTSLFGQPQSWYDNINSLQNQLAVLQAGISAIGQDAWDMVNEAYQTNGGASSDLGNAPPHFDDYQSTMARLLSDSQGLVITTNTMPTQDQINSASYSIAWWNPELTYATAMVPELAPQVQADMAQSQAMVSQSSLKSPAAVGAQTFTTEVAARAQALGVGILNVGQYVVWGLGALALIYVTTKMNFRSRS